MNARHGHFGRVFFFLHAYTTSDLRTFRRTCVHVRKECSLEISVINHVKKSVILHDQESKSDMPFV